MSNLLTNIKLAVGFVITAAIGILYLMLGREKSKHQDTRQERDSYERSTRNTQAKSRKETALDRAVKEQQKANAEAQRQRNEVPKADRRTGVSRSSDRLHK